jgi:hypothetical protein
MTCWRCWLSWNTAPIPETCQLCGEKLLPWLECGKPYRENINARTEETDMADAPTTKLSTRHLRREGWTVDVCQRYIHQIQKSKDLFGFLDIVAVRSNIGGVLGIQTTVESKINARLDKILSIPAARVWLAAGNDIQIHGWRKRAGKWAVKVKTVTLAHFPRKESHGTQTKVGAGS